MLIYKQRGKKCNEECEKEGKDIRKRPLFEFCTEDVIASKTRATGWDESCCTEFDHLLLSSWDRAMKDGVFRYDLSDVVTRTVPGRYGIIAMNNPKRFSHRRPPADMQSLVQPFDPNQFHFNRIKPQEVLFDVHRKMKPDIGQEKRHMVAVNVSPIDRGHVLLVPEPISCLPQVMTADSLQLCLELMSLSGHRGFCMIANSLLAYASVNHLHYHFMYTTHHLLAAEVDGRQLPGTGGCYELTGHYVRGFGFQMDSDPKKCASAIFHVISILLECGVPYNIVMLRGTPFSDALISSPPSLIRTILVPRRPALGFKQLYQQEGDPPPFFAASCELGLGLIPILVGFGFNGFNQLDASRDNISSYDPDNHGLSHSLSTSSPEPRVLMELSHPPSSVAVSSSWDALHVYTSEDGTSHSLTTGRWSSMVQDAQKLLRGVARLLRH